MNPPKNIRCVVVDDSTIYRNVVRNVLNDTPGVEVVGVAKDGVQALERIHLLKPDLITLDLEMPHLDGIGVLDRLAADKIKVASIVLSACSPWGAQTTNTALRHGAFDFVLKPNTSSPEESIRNLKHDLTPKINAFISSYTGFDPSNAPSPSQPKAVEATPKPSQALCHPRVLVIGVSTGGPQALTSLMPLLPASFPIPILIVQHMPPLFTKSLADDLNGRCPLTVHEASHRQPVRAGNVYIAPGGTQMLLNGSQVAPQIGINNDPPERNCQPSVDYLFRSAAKLYGENTLGVVLTGMGDDGTIGAGIIREKGGSIIVQDEASCVVFGMPGSIVKNGLANKIAPLNQIAGIVTSAALGRNLTSV